MFQEKSNHRDVPYNGTLSRSRMRGNGYVEVCLGDRLLQRTSRLLADRRPQGADAEAARALRAAAGAPPGRRSMKTLDAG